MLQWIPIIGRMSIRDYFRLVLAFAILITEPFFRFIFRIFPAVPSRRYSHQKLKSNAADLVNACGLKCEDHFVTTKDGYILGIQRIVDPSRASASGPPVLLWHGFLMSSEVWICSPDPRSALPITLAKAGYDVWLANSRGNKYSAKHIKWKLDDAKFWNFCFDQIALDDLPSTVNYILAKTHKPSLSYIGFSQGSAQGFAGLSLNHDLNKKINLFIALAPVTKPIGLGKWELR